MSGAHHRRIERSPGAAATLDHQWLVDLAHTLERVPDAPAVHVVVTADPDGRTDERTVELHPLPPADPVEGLLGRRAPGEVCAVGLAGPAWVHALDDTRAPGSGGFVHLVTDQGISVTVIPPHRPGERSQVLGPTGDIQVGHVADACRRIVGLPTAAPPPDTIDLLVDDWLDRTLAASLVNAGLSWADVLECHPLLLILDMSDRPWTPSILSEVMGIAGRSVTWHSIRAAHLERAEDGTRSREWLEWMDAGMFARWVLGEALPRSVVLDALDRNLPGSVHDRIAATISLLDAHQETFGTP